MKQATVAGLFAVAVASVVLVAAVHASDDEVFLTDPDVSMIGQVSVVGDHFEISAQGVRQSFKYSRIKSLVFDTEQQDPDWSGGQHAYWDEKWAGCYDRMTNVIRLIEGGQTYRPVVLPFAYYYYALSAGKTGHADISTNYFNQLFAMADFKKGHPLYAEALGQSALIMVQSGHISDAEKLLPKLRDADPAMGNYVTAEVALVKNDLAGAADAFKALAGSSDPVMKARAMMGATRVALAKKDYDGAVASAKAAIDGGKGNDLIQSDAEYYLGVALQNKAPNGKNDEERAAALQQAAMAYMRVIAVYGNSSDKRLLAADNVIACFDKLAQFQVRVDTLKGIPYSRYSAKVKAWKNAQGTN